MVSAQTKVANYSYGKPGTDTYEQLSFWMKDGQKSSIDYTYGKDRKDVKLRYVGKYEASFQVRFPNNTTLTVNPKGTTLIVVNTKSNYAKTFVWEYEGPVNGIGTFCNVCAQDEKEAMRLIRTYYLH
ncbi:hypothetical protein GCM10028774_40320 [Spirosoma jeollabukense]